jgi:hypothetical protein
MIRKRALPVKRKQAEKRDLRQPQGKYNNCESKHLARLDARRPRLSSRWRADLRHAMDRGIKKKIFLNDTYPSDFFNDHTSRIPLNPHLK